MSFAQSLNNQSSSVLRVNVMVVDDDPIFLQIMSRMLQKSKYIDPSVMEITVIAAKGSMEALSTLKIQRNNIDLIITDYYMPGMNGLQLKSEITREFGNLPVIVMSSDNEKEEESLTCGAMCFITKPIKANDLTMIYEYALTYKRNGKALVWTAQNYHKDVVDVTTPLPPQIELLPDEQPSDLNITKKKCSSGTDNSPNGSCVDDGSPKTRKRKSNNTSSDDLETDQFVPCKKAKVTWTDDLHDLFLQAIRHIGLDKAVPKKILQYMNVPYLTRENVASHLQKYRMFLRRVAERGLMFSKMLSGRGIDSTFPYAQNREPYNNYYTASSSWFDKALSNRSLSSYSKLKHGVGQSRLLSNTRDTTTVRSNQMPYNYMNRSSTYEPNRIGSNSTLPIIKTNHNLSNQRPSSQNKGKRSMYEPPVMINETGQTSQVRAFGKLGPDTINGSSLNNNMTSSYGSFTPNQTGLNSYASLTPNRSGLNKYGSLTLNQTVLNGYESATPNQQELINSYESLTPNQAGLKGYGSMTPNQAGLSSYGSATPNQLGLRSYESLTPNQTGLKSYGSMTPNQTGLNSYGSATPNQQGLRNYESLTPNQTGLKSYGSMTPNQTGLNNNGSATPKEQGLISYGSLTPNQTGLKSYGSMTPNQTRLSGYGSATPKQQGLNNYESLSPNLTGLNNYGSFIPNQTGLSSYGTLTSNQQGLRSYGSLTPNQTGLSSYGSATLNQSRSSHYGSLTTNQSGSSSCGSLTTNQLGLSNYESLTPYLPSGLNSYGSLTPIEPELSNFSFGMHSFLNNENVAYNPPQQPHANATTPPSLEIPELEKLNLFDDLDTNEFLCDISNFQFGHNKEQGDMASTNFDLPNFPNELNQTFSIEENDDWTFVNINQGPFNGDISNTFANQEMNTPVFNMNPNHNQEQDGVPDFPDWSFLDVEGLVDEEFMDSLFVNDMN